MPDDTSRVPGPDTATALLAQSPTRARQRACSALVRVLSRGEVWLDRVVWALRRRFGRLGPLQVVAYRSFGTAGRALLRGRVLEASVLERSLPADTRFTNVRRMLRRFNSREVPSVQVSVHYCAEQQSALTDDEGYFDLELPFSMAPGVEDGWWYTPVAAVAAPLRGFRPVVSVAEVRVPGSSAELAVISDIDDTVLQSHVTQKLRMLWVTLSGSAFTRMPFDGTRELYAALVGGMTGRADNPVFYVSKSPWNLYDFLIDFLEHHGLPRGPLLLRDIGLRDAPPIDHKSACVHRLLELYPQLPVVLIGDSGERDAEIYVAAAARFPGRIRAIYIRDLSGQAGAQPLARSLSEQARQAGAEMLWVAHAGQALEHARRLSLVR